MIKNIIFDLGNVLLKFQPQKLIMDTFSDEKTCKALMDSVFRAPEWLELDKGTLTDEQAIRVFIANNPTYSNEIQKIMAVWTQALTPIEEHVNVLKDLKRKGFNCYILSNFHKTAYEEQREQHEFFNCFDGGVVSAYVHKLKPHHDIYKSLLDKYDLTPESCLFLDDMEENIHAARQLGIHGIKVEDDMGLGQVVEVYLTQINEG